ncbi:uncharacterized protein [Aquarana catesbeiana]|uniref:uncharacterized protein n=1 Tax=Aquarana catesbeiana TaxID=8400 RepID=UPI003CCA21EB
MVAGHNTGNRIQSGTGRLSCFDSTAANEDKVVAAAAILLASFAAEDQVLPKLYIPMPELYSISPGMVIDIFAGNEQIGKYDNSLQGLNGYHNRLQLDREIRAIVVKNWSQVDGLSFRITIKTPENSNISSYDVYYNVTMNGEVASRRRVITGRNGSDLHIPVPELCSSSHTIFIDLFTAGKIIGNYHGSLEGLKEYQNRLLYDKTCVFILKNWTPVDGLIFKAHIRIFENSQTAEYDVYYNVSINGDAKRSISSTTNLTLPSVVLLSAAVLFYSCLYYSKEAASF